MIHNGNDGFIRNVYRQERRRFTFRTRRRRLKRLIGLVCLLAGWQLYAQRPALKFIYPRENQTVTAVDSAFVIGNVPPGSRLWINGIPVSVYENGAFLAFLPVSSGPFIFQGVALMGEDTLKAERRITVPERLHTWPLDSLGLDSSFVMPRDSVWAIPGDVVEVSFKGTPGCQAFFDIDGIAWGLPMAERRPSMDYVTGDAVFGDLEVDTAFVQGIYTGLYQVQPWDYGKTASIGFHLKSGEDSVHMTAPGPLTVINSPIPRMGILTAETVIARPAPGQAYTWFLPKGVRVRIAGRHGSWVRTLLGGVQEAWIPEGSYKLLPAGTPLPREIVRVVRKEFLGDKTRISIPLQNRIPFHIQQSVDPPALRLTLYGVWSDTDWIPGDSDDPVVRGITWRQVASHVYELEILLNQEQQWGYGARYDQSTLQIDIKTGPDIAGWPSSPLKGRTICLDPGHKPGTGAVGPMGIEEQEVNLAVAVALKDLLGKAGAQVIMTREQEEEILLAARPRLAAAVNADALISIHFNAVPDNVNPWNHNGSSTYYYQPMSRRLAEYIHSEVLRELGLPDFGLFYANLALVRPTEMVAVLTEEAFIIHPEHEALLVKPEYQKRCARAIYRGLVRFFKENR